MTMHLNEPTYRQCFVPMDETFDSSQEVFRGAISPQTKELISQARVQLMSMSNDKVLGITGSSYIGKTFVVQSLFASVSQHKYIHSYGGRVFAYWVKRLPENDPQIIAQLLNEAREFDGLKSNDQVVLVTDNFLIAGTLWALRLDVKIIFMTVTDEIQSLIPKTPSSFWEIFNIEDFDQSNSDVFNMIAPYREHAEESLGLFFEDKEIKAFIRLVGKKATEENKKVLYGQWVKLFNVACSLVAEMEYSSDNRLVEAIKNNPFATQKIFDSIASSAGTTNSSISNPFNATPNVGANVAGGVFTHHANNDENHKTVDNSASIEYNNIDTLVSVLKKNLIGQDETINEVVKSLAVPMAGMNSPHKPLRTMLFLGSTGVGKTSMAEIIANNLYTEPVPLIKIDMGEYKERHSAVKFTGAPPGYLGYGEDGKLVAGVKANSKSIILLDEIEKAHSDVWDNFLGLFDRGTLTTGSGETIDMRQTIIIMTSNLGTQELLRSNIGFNTVDYVPTREHIEKVTTKAVKEYFRPEMVNRFDHMIIFNSLDKEHIENIGDLEYQFIVQRAKDAGYHMKPLGNDVLTHILKESKVAEYGAREIQRVMNNRLSSPLAMAMLHAKKNSTFDVQYVNNEIVVEKIA